jgi:hypothetical protein
MHVNAVPFAQFLIKGSESRVNLSYDSSGCIEEFADVTLGRRFVGSESRPDVRIPGLQAGCAETEELTALKIADKW